MEDVSGDSGRAVLLLHARGPRNIGSAAARWVRPVSESGKGEKALRAFFAGLMPESRERQWPQPVRAHVTALQRPFWVAGEGFCGDSMLRWASGRSFCPADGASAGVEKLPAPSLVRVSTRGWENDRLVQV